MIPYNILFLFLFVTGNTWGVCQNGTQGVGCGNQETFINCADVSITTNTAGFGPTGQIPVEPSTANNKQVFKEEESFIRPPTTDERLVVRYNDQPIELPKYSSNLIIW